MCFAVFEDASQFHAFKAICQILTGEGELGRCTLYRGLKVAGHDLGFKVVAEGVETAEQEQFLKSSNCDLLQGYYFSKPQKADEIEKFIKDFITPDD